MFADALWDHVTTDPEELSFVVGDTIEVTDMDDTEWWGGTANGCTGWFPASYVRVSLCSAKQLAVLQKGWGDIGHDPFSLARRS